MPIIESFTAGFIQERHKGTPISGVFGNGKSKVAIPKLYPGKSDDITA